MSQIKSIPLVKISNVNMLIDCLSEIEPELYDLLEMSGFPENYFDCKHGYMSAEPLHQLFMLLAQRHSADNLITIFSKAIRKSLVPNIVSKIVYAETIGDALKILINNVAMESPATKIEIVPDIHGATLYRHIYKAYDKESVWSELFTILSFLEVIRAFGDENYQPSQIYFHSSEAYKLSKTQALKGTAISTGYDKTGIKLSQELIDHPYNPVQYRQVLFSEEVLKTTFVDSVYMVTEAYFGDSRLSLQWVAGILDITTRTLQRRLNECNVSFRDIKDSIMVERAIHLLLNTDKTLIQVAIELGYSNAPQFSRAFKRMTGYTPGILSKTSSSHGYREKDNK